MPAIDFDTPAMVKHLAFAEQHYEREFSTPQLLKALRSRGLDTETAQAVVKKMKSLRRGPARKAGLITFGIGLAMVVVTALVMLATGMLFWYIGLAGIVMALFGLGQAVTGIAKRDG